MGYGGGYAEGYTGPASVTLGGTSALTGDGTVARSAEAVLAGVADVAPDATTTSGGAASLAARATMRPSPNVDLDPYRDLIMASGPVGYWRLDDSTINAAVDSSGNNLHGAYAGASGLLLQQPGALRNSNNKAVTFNGTSNYVDLGRPAALMLPQITIEAWFKTSSLSALTIYRWRFHGVELRLNGGFLYAYLYTAPNTAATLVAAGRWSDNKWHHAAFTFDTEMMRLFVDGVQRGTYALSPTNIYYENLDGHGAAIGRDGTAAQNYWNGQLDEVAVYNRALTPAEITARAQRGVFQAGWAYDTDLPVGLQYPAIVGLNGLIYSIGGYSSFAASSLLAFDPVTRTWTYKAYMPAARYGVAACVHRGKIYAHGGHGDYNTLYVYDPALNTWSHLNNSPFSRGSHTMAGSDVTNKLYTFGPDLYVYDVETNQWTLGTMVSPRWYCRAVEHPNGKIYVSGGQGSALVQEFDPGTQTFTSKASMSSTREQHGMAVFRDLVWVVGGSPNSAQVLSYDPATNAWTTRESLNLGRWTGNIAGATDVNLFAVGGYAGSSRLETERYTYTATPAVATIPLSLLLYPYPHGQATISLDLSVHSDAEEIGGTLVPKPGFIRTGYRTGLTLQTVTTELV